MLEETKSIVYGFNDDFLPLKTYVNITEGNALRIDWNDVISVEKLSYIMGNPPFVGFSFQTKEQKADILSVYIDEKGKSYKTAGKVDYVAGWYFKASQYIWKTKIRVAFVSTNSITQGEQVSNVWKPLYERFGIHINFAYRTFIWDSEANVKAHVHCVIIGFSGEKIEKCILFENGNKKIVKNINMYLLDSEDIFIESRKDALCDVPEISKGFQATDNGYLILNEEEKEDLLVKEPSAEKWIRPYSMGVEFIKNTPRYCLWLVDIKPNELQQMPLIKKRVSDCKKWRESATKTGDAYKLRNIPHLFRPCKQFKDVPYIAVPLVSSENRRYIPMGFINNGMIPGNNLFSIFNAGIYHFGILQSNVHMAWMRAICGRLKSDYRYSSGLVYNNFPWPTPTVQQKERIEQTAQKILDVRSSFSESNLADLYDPLTMPPELRKAHTANDKAVMAAYGFSTKMTEADCVAELMKLYQRLVQEK